MTLLEVGEKADSVVAFHLPIRSLKTRSALNVDDAATDNLTLI